MTPTRRSVLTRSSVALAGLLLAGSASADSSIDSQLDALAQSSVAEVSDEQVAELAEAVTAFGLDLHRELRAAEPDENLLASPYSASIALAMTWAGARGETEAEMADTLRFPFDQDELHAVYEDLDGLVDPPSEEGQGETDDEEATDFTLETANALWGHEGFPFADDFLELLEAHYGAGMNEVDFETDPEAARETINQWVETQTEDRIEDLLPEGSVDELTRLVLTNAVYFAASWHAPFEEDRTEDGTFTTLEGEPVTVPMMTQEGHFEYAEVDGTQALSLPYEGHDVDMMLVVPPAGEFEAFEESLDASTLSSLFEELESTYGVVSLPRFSYESDFSLVETLEALGMEAAFDPATANFDGMVDDPDDVPNLFVDDVLQKTFIDVDETGTEAAAATAVSIAVESAPVVQYEVAVDRPFYFAIRHRETNAALFLGRVVDLEDEGGETPAEIVDSEFEALEVTTDEPADAADVRVDETADWQVEVAGEMLLPQPCYGVDLAAVAFEDGTLRVELERHREVEGACPDVVASGAYEARFALSEAPTTVVVEHVDNEWETTWEADGEEGPPSVGEYDPLPAGEDGLYRDVDGSGTLGSNDVVTFFEHLEEPAISEYPTYYDFNGSGGVGFDDVVALFGQV